jgi:hypothetical protein
MGHEKGFCIADSIAILCRFFCKFDVNDRANKHGFYVKIWPDLHESKPCETTF